MATFGRNINCSAIILSFSKSRKPFNIPYNFRQSLPRGDTITSPMIYDQSLLREGGKETIYEQ